MSLSDTEIAARLIVAVVLSGLIGLERESHGRPAGLRTHILVGLGATLVMLISIYGFGPGLTFDPGRLAAQVVSGIGFLGAGTIMRDGSTVRGLTTAASLWVAAGIGLGVGAGFYFASFVCTLLVVFSLQVLVRVEQWFQPNRQRSLSVRIIDEPGCLGRIASTLGEQRVNIRAVTIEPEDERTSLLVITVDRILDEIAIVESLTQLDCVEHVSLRL